MSTAAQALSDDELAELDDFLLSEACSDETLTLDEAHGYLTALLAGPEQTTEEEWLHAVWGQPQFADEAEAERMTGLLRRLYLEVAADLRAGRLEPLTVEEEGEGGELVEGYEGWCFGFMLAVADHEQAWSDLPKDVDTLFAPMSQLALLESEEEAEMDEDEYASWVELLPGAVLGLYGYWHGEERLH